MSDTIGKPRLFGLDLMRCCAILMVLFGHCLWIYPESNSFFHQLMLLCGFLGVEVFFVLSGFLIGKILYQLFLKDDFNYSSLLSFLIRRWFRTLPNYYLVLLLIIGLVSFFGTTTKSLWSYFFFLQNFNSPMLRFFPESWSLSVEEFAYVTLPFFIIVLYGFFKPKRKSLFFIGSLLALITVFICTKIYYHFTTLNTDLKQWNLSLKAVVLYRLDSIFIGVVFSWLYYNYLTVWIKYKNVLATIGGLILFFQFVLLGNLGVLIATHPFYWNVIYLPLLSLGIAFFLPFLSEWKTEQHFLQKPITLISKISYSIYLLHYSVILYTMKQFFATKSFSMTALGLFTIFYLSLTLLLSYVLYVYYEKPMMDLRDKFK